MREETQFAVNTVWLTVERKQKMEMQITLKTSVNGGNFHNWY